METILFIRLVSPIDKNLVGIRRFSLRFLKSLKKNERAKIKPSKLLRKEIEDEIKRREAEKLKEDIERLKPVLDKVT
jgi:hypothetical protein